MASVQIGSLRECLLGFGAHALVDGWVTSRFHTGPDRPAVLRVSGVWGARGGGTIGITSRTPVSSRVERAGGDVLAVTAGGRPLRCNPPVESFAAGEPIRGEWTCRGEVGASETLQVTLLVDDLETAEGLPARTCGEGTPPRWVARPFAAGELVIPGRDCPDSAFLP